MPKTAKACPKAWLIECPYCQGELLNYRTDSQFWKEDHIEDHIEDPDDVRCPWCENFFKLPKKVRFW